MGWCMKITDRISCLVLELGEYESFESLDKLVVQEELSLRNVLGLFCETENPSSRDLIQKILEEAGFGWFDKANPSEVQKSLEDALLTESVQGLVADNELMRMLPVNTYLH